MAADEALWRAVSGNASPPTLRFYQWNPPTVSLGYFQKYAEVASLESPLCDWPVVRRLTGGGAIAHSQEWTYSLTLPGNHRFLSDGATSLYDRIHAAFSTTLAQIGFSVHRHGGPSPASSREGPTLCFQRRYRQDLVDASGEKVVGSAQRRGRGGILQHGSIVLVDESARAAWIAQGVPVLAESLNARFEPGTYLPHETEARDQLLGRYAGDEWNRRR